MVILLTFQSGFLDLLIIKVYNILVLVYYSQESMSNDICCIIKMKRKQYEHLSSRLSTFGITYVQTKKLKLEYLVPKTRKGTQQSKYSSPKLQSPIIRLQSPTTTTLVLNPSSASFVPSYSALELSLYEATFLRAENSFNKIMKNWSIFNNFSIPDDHQVQENFNRNVQIYVYSWKGAFLFQFYSVFNQDSQGEENDKQQQILMSITDCTSTNVIDKNIRVDKQYWRNKLQCHFRDIYAMLCGTFNEGNPHQIDRGTQHNNYGVQSKSVQFRIKLQEFVQKLMLLQEKQNHKYVQFWMLKLVFLVELAMSQRINIGNTGKQMVPQNLIKQFRSAQQQ